MLELATRRVLCVRTGQRRHVGWEIRMDGTESIPTLKRKLDVLLARDVSAMGYEAKAQHHHRLETARIAYQTALDEARKQEVKSPVGR